MTKFLSSVAVQLTALLLVGAQTEMRATEHQCWVSGLVTDFRSRQPVPRATVLVFSAGLHSQAEPPAATVNVTTNTEGKFCLEDRIAPGMYGLSAEKVGYLKTQLGAVTPFQESSVFEVHDAQVAGLVVQIIPISVVTGRVIDEHGDPVVDGLVQAVARKWSAGQSRHIPARGVSPNDLGEYRIAPLLPGEYVLVYEPRPPNPSEPVGDSANDAVVRTFYPSTIDASQAAPVNVGVGDVAQSNDIVIQRRRPSALKGNVLVGGATPSIASLTLSPVGHDPAALVVGNSGVGPGGAFVFPNIAPADYDLHYLAGDAGGFSVGTVGLRVGAEEVAQVRLDIEPPVTIEGFVRVEAGGGGGSEAVDLESAAVGIKMVSGFHAPPSYSAPVASDGGFVLPGCSPGDYEVLVSLKGSYYIKEVRYEDKDVSNTALSIRNPGGLLEVVMAPDPASIGGRVVTDGLHKEAAWYYALAKQGVDVGANSPHLGITGSDGRFEVTNLSPGTYRMLAFSNIDLRIVESAAIHSLPKAWGIEVSVQSGDHIDVDVEPLSAAEGAEMLRALLK